MTKVYTFNRPWVALVLLPLVLLTALLLYGVFQELNVMVIVMSVVSLLFLLPVVYVSFLRRMRLSEEQVEWKTPRAHHSIFWTEIKSYGVVRYRSFRFMYVSRLPEVPFKAPNQPVVSTEDTFVIQFRRPGWTFLKKLVQRQHPDLEPENFSRK